MGQSKCELILVTFSVRDPIIRTPLEGNWVFGIYIGIGGTETKGHTI